MPRCGVGHVTHTQVRLYRRLCRFRIDR